MLRVAELWVAVGAFRITAYRDVRRFTLGTDGKGLRQVEISVLTAARPAGKYF